MSDHGADVRDPRLLDERRRLLRERLQQLRADLAELHAAYRELPDSGRLRRPALDS